MTSTALVVMGVAGCGKTTVGVELAARLGWTYAEADDFHPPENKAKMSAGSPLTDVDREPWLEAIRDWVSAQHADVVVTCSALRQRYRDVLRQADARVRFLHLHGSEEVLASRIGGRTGHFMPASLLRSQLDTLEPLQPNEDGVVISVEQPASRIVDEALRALDLPG